jgi:hypothetical protein
VIIVEFVDEYANGAACVANILAGEDLVAMRVLGRVSKSTASTTRPGYVSGHPAPIAGLLEECPPWPT